MHSSVSRRSRLASLRGPQSANPSAPSDNRAAEFAWRVHAAQEAWAGKADVKASILLALEAGALYAIMSALGNGGFLARSGRQPRLADTVGILLVLLAILAAAIAIFPRLGLKGESNNRQPNAIYFGDLRRWSSMQLRSYLENLTEHEELEALSRQLTEMGRHNWAKHRWVQISLILSLAGIFMIAFGAVALS
jgi:hypothetical protein